VRRSRSTPGSMNDGELNLPVEKYSHDVRRRVALEAAKGAFDAGVETLATYTGAHVPKRQFEQLVVRGAETDRGARGSLGQG
jgi:hypothetical protein